MDFSVSEFFFWSSQSEDGLKKRWPTFSGKIILVTDSLFVDDVRRLESSTSSHRR